MKERELIVLTNIILKKGTCVSLDAYFNVLRDLGLQDDFLKLASDDQLGRKLQDLKLIGKKGNDG